MTINEHEIGSTCHKCKEELYFDREHPNHMESEYWYCPKCDIEYEVDVELVRDWSTLQEAS